MVERHGESLGSGVTFGLLAALLLVGMALGVVLAEFLAPGSAIARCAGFGLLPLCLGGSILAPPALAWARSGAAGFAGTGEGRRCALPRLAVAASRPSAGLDAFLSLPLMLAVACGAVIGVLPGSIGVVGSVAMFALLGLGYALVLREIARAAEVPA